MGQPGAMGHPRVGLQWAADQALLQPPHHEDPSKSRAGCPGQGWVLFLFCFIFNRVRFGLGSWL